MIGRQLSILVGAAWVVTPTRIPLRRFDITNVSLFAWTIFLLPRFAPPVIEALAYLTTLEVSAMPECHVCLTFLVPLS